MTRSSAGGLSPGGSLSGSTASPDRKSRKEIPETVRGSELKSEKTAHELHTYVLQVRTLAATGRQKLKPGRNTHNQRLCCFCRAFFIPIYPRLFSRKGITNKRHSPRACERAMDATQPKETNSFHFELCGSPL